MTIVRAKAMHRQEFGLRARSRSCTSSTHSIPHIYGKQSYTKYNYNYLKLDSQRRPSDADRMVLTSASRTLAHLKSREIADRR